MKKGNKKRAAALVKRAVDGDVEALREIAMDLGNGNVTCGLVVLAYMLGELSHDHEKD